jgi:hypothetical protein
MRTLTETSKDHGIMLHAKPWEHPNAVAILVYHYPPVSLNQLFQLLHSCFIHNLNRATWLGIIHNFQSTSENFLTQS